MLRFYKKNTNNYENNSFLNNMIAHNNPSYYVNEFLNKFEQPYYGGYLFGGYGFENIDGWDEEYITLQNINNCAICFDNPEEVVRYTIISNDPQEQFPLAGKLIIKVRGTGEIRIRIDSSTVHTYNIDTEEYENLIYDIDVNEQSLTVDFLGEFCVQGIAVAEPSIPYTVCNNEFEAPLSDISPNGAVYLLKSVNYYDWVELSSAYSDQINAWEITVLKTTVQAGQGDFLRLTVNGQHFQYYEWIYQGNDYTLHQAYNWLSYKITNETTNTITYRFKVPDFITFEVQYVSGANTTTYIPTLIDTATDNNYIYIGENDFLDLLPLQDDYYISVGKVGNLANTMLPYYSVDTQNSGISYNQYNLYQKQNQDILINKNATVFYYMENSSNNNTSVYAQLSKKAYLAIKDKICCIEIEDKKSEPFIIVEETDKMTIEYTPTNNKKLVKGFTYHLLFDGYLKRLSDEEDNTFVGQKRNYTLKNTHLNMRELKNKTPIPDYLLDILAFAFTCDVKIDGIAYSKGDSPEYDYLDEQTLFADFSIKLRLIE